MYTVNASIGLPCEDLNIKPVNGFWSSYLVHSLQDGTFKELWLSDRVKAKIVEKNIYAKRGDKVKRYLGSNDTLGTLILRFDTMDEMLDMVDNMERDIRVITE